MLGAVSSFLFNMLLWNNMEDFSKAFIKGGEYIPNTSMLNTPTKKIFGKGIDEILKEKGVKATFKGMAKKGIASTALYYGASSAFGWFFSPYVAPFKIAYDGIKESLKEENNYNKKKSLGLNVDESSLYMIDERSSMLRNNIIQSSSIQEQHITQLLNTPNLSSKMMNDVLSKYNS